MMIEPIKGIAGITGNTASSGTDSTMETGTAFSAFLSSAVDNLEQTNQLQKTADQMSVDFAVGRIDNIADVMIAQEKASVALQYTVQLRNKLLDAYNEIMRIQV